VLVRRIASLGDRSSATWAFGQDEGTPTLVCMMPYSTNRPPRSRVRSFLKQTYGTDHRPAEGVGPAGRHAGNRHPANGCEWQNTEPMDALA